MKPQLTVHLEIREAVLWSRVTVRVGLGLGNRGPSELELAALGTFQEGCCKWLVTICDPELLSIMGF